MGRERKGGEEVTNSTSAGTTVAVRKAALLAFAYQGKDIVFRFIIEYGSLIKRFWPLGNNIRSILI